MDYPALVTAIGGVVGTLVGMYAIYVKLKLGMAQLEMSNRDLETQITNDHDINLRDDMDAKHDAIIARLDEHKELERHQHSDIWEAIHAINSRIENGNRKTNPRSNRKQAWFTDLD